MTEDFIRERITALRLKKGVSEYRMSMDLGHSKGYIQSISSGRALPSLQELLYICDYFGITPHEFFSEGEENPIIITNIMKKLTAMNDEDLSLVLSIVDRLNK
ncbi:MAG: helix-turn-helix transcriptional regulator [Ruminococcus sp.]|nr:helix-turn-helix transcriptional regulator [Ruminococcus sp.]